MALFGSKKKTEEPKAVKAVKAPSKAVTTVSSARISRMGVILSPRVTEKAARGAEENHFVFNVAPNATKKTVAQAIRSLYKVSPIRVNMTKVMPKQIFVRGKVGVKSGGKKATVFLKKGETIDLA